METKIAVYFCDPQSPWQRGSNENTNRLLPQYFPTDLSVHSQARLNSIARELNERPRMTLGYPHQPGHRESPVNYLQLVDAGFFLGVLK